MMTNERDHPAISAWLVTLSVTKHAEIARTDSAGSEGAQ
jgi:hypothetical protein